MLGTWRHILKDGLTTWQESERTAVRSDCHAWGSSPNVELFRTVLGIHTAASGFQRVRIEPNPGKLARGGEPAAPFWMTGEKPGPEVNQ